MDLYGTAAVENTSNPNMNRQYISNLLWMCQEFTEYQYPLRGIPDITAQDCLKVFEQ